MLETLLTAEVQHKFTWMWFSLPWRYFMVRAAPSREISQRGYNNFIIFRYYMTKYSFTRKYKEPNGTHKLLETYTSMKAQVKGIIWILYSLYSRKKKKKNLLLTFVYITEIVDTQCKYVYVEYWMMKHHIFKAFIYQLIYISSQMY